MTGATEWHINADEPIVLDYNTDFKSAGHIETLYAPDAYRSSDHDPVLVGLDLLAYDFGGFQSPVNPGGVTQRNAGSALPIKFSLDGNKGLAVLDGTPMFQRHACPTGTAIGAPIAATRQRAVRLRRVDGHVPVHLEDPEGLGRLVRHPDRGPRRRRVLRPRGALQVDRIACRPPALRRPHRRRWARRPPASACPRGSGPARGAPAGRPGTAPSPPIHSAAGMRDRRRDDAAQDLAERDGAPHDEAHRGVHPALHRASA